MLECEWCGDPDCCERLDLEWEPILCNECYLSAKEFEEERCKNDRSEDQTAENPGELR